MTIRITGDGPKITATGSGSTVLVEISTGQHDPGSFSGVHNDLTGRSTTGAHVGTAVSIDPSGFAGNLDESITNAQLLAAAVDDLTTGGGGGGGGASLSDATPQALGTAAAGTGTAAARDDHVHAMPTAADVGAAATSHNHAASEVTSGTLDIARIPTGTTSTTVPLGNDSRFTDSRTPTSHNHAGTDITSGTVAVARLPVGTTSSDVAAGNDSRITGALQKVAAGASVEDIGAVESNVNTVAATGSTETLDLATYGVHDCTMDQSCTFTFSNPAPSGKSTIFTLILRGAYTPTLPASIKWAGTAPTYTTPSQYVFTTVDGGTTYYGQQVGAAFA